MNRRLRFWSIVLLVPLALVAIVITWVFASGSGARFAVARAIAASGGKLTVAQIDGTLAGPLTLRDVRYRDTGVDVRIAQVVLDIAPRALISRTLHVRDIGVTDLTVTLVTQPPTTTPKPFSLQPPIAIVIDRLRVDRAGLVQDGVEKLPVDSVDLVGAWTADGLTIGRFALRAPEGEITLDGQLTSYDRYTGDSRGTFRWIVDGVTYAGTLGVTSDGKLAGVQFALREPTAATMQAQLQHDARWPWTIALQVPTFDPKRVVPDSTLEALAADLRGSGDRTGGTLTGDVDINAHTIKLDPFRFVLTKALLRIDALTLRSPDAPGHLDAVGTIDFATTPPLANLDVVWDGVELPADLAGQTLHSRGALKLSGSNAKYAATGAFAIGPPGKLVDVTVDAVGVADTITLNRLALVQQRGKLEATGEVVLRPQLGWTVDATATNFDPGALFAAWPGSVSAQLHSAGTRDDAGVHATLKLDRLTGQLRERRLAGHADLRIEPGQVIDGTMQLESGASSLTLRGRGGDDTDATIAFNVASLGDLLPAAQGSARGEFTLKGRWPALAVNGRLDGRAIAVDDVRAATLHVDVALHDASAPAGSLELSATDATIAGMPFERVVVHGEGDRNAHVLKIDADGEQLGVDLALRGTNTAASWSGTLTQLRLDAQAQGVWELRGPVALAWNDTGASVGELCLANAPARLCIEGTSARDGSAHARYSVEAVPLALIVSLVAAESTLRVDGNLDGTGDIRRTPGGELTGSATVKSAQGRVAYPDTGERPLLDYSGFTVAAQMRGLDQQLTVHATLADGGSIDGDIRASGADRRLAGQVSIRMTNLGVVELLTTELAAVKGRLAGALRVGGTLADPELSGDVAIDDLATEVPRAGLKLHDGTLRIGALGADRYTVEGHIRSGDGEITISGRGGSSADAPLRAQLNGENFLAVDIPAARVVVSPQLTLERTPEKLLVGGSLAIPAADVDLDKMPGGGAAKTSPDVVVTDAPTRETTNALPIRSDVTVTLGDDVKLKGFGFDGKLDGQLVVIDRPGRQTIGRGEIRASGTYKAYGQNLKITSGRVLFAGTAIDNPGLDLRAVRELKDVTAGLRVQGTAQVPVLTVYAEPAMEQSEALSYLITGRPLSSLNNSEGSLVGAAAQALGSATGDLLAKSVGARLGVEASVSDSTALGGSAFTVGKYLSPKVYVSYGVGLFTPGEVITLRYILSKRWELEVQNATTENRAGINYRYEK